MQSACLCHTCSLLDAPCASAWCPQVQPAESVHTCNVFDCSQVQSAWLSTRQLTVQVQSDWLSTNARSAWLSTSAVWPALPCAVGVAIPCLCWLSDQLKKIFPLVKLKHNELRFMFKFRTRPNGPIGTTFLQGQNFLSETTKDENSKTFHFLYWLLGRTHTYYRFLQDFCERGGVWE